MTGHVRNAGEHDQAQLALSLIATIVGAPCVIAGARTTAIWAATCQSE
jgi:hypothetical protein